MSIGEQEVVDVSYLSDTIIAMTFFEAAGRIRRAVSVVKKKYSEHDTAIHELTIAGGRIQIDDHVLSQFHNVMVPANALTDQRIEDGSPG